MIRVRAMQEDDIPGVSAVRVKGWQAAYRGMVPQDYLDALTVAEDIRIRRDLFVRGAGRTVNLIAEDGGDVVGWAALGASSEEDRRPRDGELFALYADPGRLRTGIGTALLQQTRAAARERSLDRLVLWVVAANTGARRFYERCGFAPDGRGADWTVNGTAVPELRYSGPADPP